ncbi:gonadotropin-releasing hormone receptor-like [Paramacrobiotus metropolitanus]|uniref:gonadotropin-releasing hormone receptor-like n=1 Tax=Paramacrobiotus metropolitanus TaxID=2943436 RepID=UPI002445A824|nr:gonadotropin-releasing hormone receptor-like [Paramacrobiotus metropolitanus]
MSGNILMLPATAGSNSTKELLGHLDVDVPGYSGYRNVYVLGLFGMAICAIPLNCAVTIILAQRCFWRSNVYFLLFQLAIADLLVAVLCMVGDAIWNITLQWLAGDFLCRLYKFLQMFSLYASTFTLTAISIDRCIAVLFPLSRSGSHRSHKRIKCMSAAAWATAALCATPQAYIFHTETAPFDPGFLQCVTHGAYTDKWQEVVYTAYTVAIMFFVPVCIMILCYVAIFTRITKESRLASGPGDVEFPYQQQACVRRALYSAARRRTLWMTLMFVICFIVCWAPYYVGMFCFLLQINIENEPLNMIFCFGMGSVILNPVIYGVFNFCHIGGKLPGSKLGSVRSSKKVRCQVVKGPVAVGLRNMNMCAGYTTSPYKYAGAEGSPRLIITFKSRAQREQRMR